MSTPAGTSPPDAAASRRDVHDSSQRDERYRALGVRSAVLLAFALSLLWALSVPAFWGVDETSHVAYAVAVSGGEWPTIHTPNPVDDFPGMANRIDYDISFGRLGRLDIWTSNHPPLYFLLVGIPLRVGLALDHAGAGMVAARLLTALGGSAGVFAVAWIARSLAPGRPRVHVVAAYCAALSPTLVHYAGQIFNDTMAFTLSTFGLAAGFAALRTGLQRRLAVICALGAGAGALTRSSGLAVAGLAVAALMLSGWYAGPRGVRSVLQRTRASGRNSAGDALSARNSSRWHRLRAGLLVGAVAGGAVAAISGWAVLVNLVRYGDPTAASDLFLKFDRVTGPSWWFILTRRQFLVDQIDRFATELSIGVWWPSVVTWITYAVLVSALVGAVLAVVGRWQGRRTNDVRSFLPGGRAIWLGFLAAALPAVLLTTSAIFISQGGYPHSRYLLPALGVLATMVAIGVEGLPRARRGYPALVILCALVIGNVALWLQFLADHQMWYQQVFPFADLPALTPMSVTVTSALALGAVALVGLVRAINGLAQGSQEGEAAPQVPTATVPVDRPAEDVVTSERAS